jgi:hypothetical protein
MRGAIRTMIGGSLTAGVLLAASVASACPAEASRESRLPASRLLTSPKGTLCQPGTSCTKIEGPARKGAMDDRLVRPHPRLDASAGVLG